MRNLLPLALAVSVMTEASACEIASSNDRLFTYCILNESHANVLSIRDVLFLSDQLESVGQEGLVSVDGARSKLDFAVYPLVQFSDNINGGNPDKPLVLGGLTFSGDPALYRKQGVLLGAGLGAHGQYRLTDSRYLAYHANGSYATSPHHDIDIRTTDTEICSVNHLGNWSYVDFCADQSRRLRELGNSLNNNASVAISKLFEFAGNYNHASLTYNRYFADDYTQNQFRMGWDFSQGDGFFTSLSAEYGEPVMGHLASRYSLRATVRANVKGKPLSATLAYGDARGGNLLGVERQEKSVSVSFSYPLTTKLHLTAGLSHTKSMIDYFDKTSPSVGLEFSALQF